MGVRLNGLLGTLTLVAASIVSAEAAVAQTATTRTPTPVVTTPIPELVNRVYYSNDRDFFQNRSLFRQLDWLLGTGSIIRNGFPENEIARDGAAINRLSQDLLRQQATSTPTIRTPDLNNPFDTSLLLLPATAPNPIPPVVETPPLLPIAPAPPQPSRPVPALY